MRVTEEQMKVIQAKIVDRMHLELSEAIEARPGEVIEIAIVEDQDIEKDWKEAALARFLKFYDDQDSIYDEL
jgi:hypothetical protein